MLIEDEQHKIHLICRPTQLRKTFATISKIKNEHDKVHIIFTKKTSIARDQFGSRLNEDEDLIIYNVGSKLQNGEKTFKSMKKMIEDIEYGYKKIPNCILMCTSITEQRMKDIDKLIRLCASKRKLVNIYFDEFQENEKGTTRVRKAHEKDSAVSEVVYISATPRKLLKEVNEVVIEDAPIDKEDLRNYKGVDYSDYNELVDLPGDPRFDEFLQKLSSGRIVIGERIVPSEKDYAFFRTIYYSLLRLEEIGIVDNGRLGNGRSIGFVFAKIKTNTHDIIKAICQGINKKIVVVVLNGNGKTLSFSFRQEDDSEVRINDIDIYDGLSNEEINELTIEKVIAKKLSSLGLERRPTVITGHICVGSSQTLISAEKEEYDGPKLPPPDYAIFGRGIVSYDFDKDGSCKGCDQASQLHGRTTGVRTNKMRTLVFCDEIFRDMAMDRQTRAMDIQKFGGQMYNL